MRLLTPVVGAIVGEEDGDAIDITTPPFRAGSIVAPAELEGTIVRLRGVVDDLAGALPQHPEYSKLTAFIDPIDGTKEFCTGKGEQCSICVGFADTATGQAVGGLVYRPLCPQRSWALGCAREGAFESELRTSGEAEQGAAATSSSSGGGGGSFLVSNSGASPFLDALRSELGYERRPAGGAGNKGLLVLEEPSACYIQDRGVSRWDSCAAQAVLEAKGGLMVQLQPFVNGALAEGGGASASSVVLTPYTYRKGKVNADFVPGASRLTKYNAADGVLTDAERAKGAPPRYAQVPSDFKPYANTLGLLALRSKEPDALEAVRAAVARAAAKSKPEYD